VINNLYSIKDMQAVGQVLSKRLRFGRWLRVKVFSYNECMRRLPVGQKRKSRE
jgi:hypothetical protein